jgi:predicted transcriptional regulator
MQCLICKGSNVKSAEQYGADRLQCGSCGTLTKRAELQLTEYQQKIINYLSSWSSEYVEKAWEVTQDLDQNGIGKAIDVSRSNIPRVIEPLVLAGLVQKKKAHILDENNRVKPVKKWVYYLAPAGKKYVSKRAESKKIYATQIRERKKCPECREENVGTEEMDFCGPCGKKGYWGEGEPVPCPYCEIITSDTDLTDYCYSCGASGDWYETEGNYAAESFEAELPILGEPIVWEQPLTSFLDSVISKGHYDGQKSGTVLGEFVAVNDHPNGYYQKGDTALITIYEEPADRNYDLNDTYIGPVFYKIQISTSSIPPTMTQHGLMAYPADVEQNWKRINSETFESEELLFPFKLISDVSRNRKAKKNDLRQRRRTPFYELPDEEESEDKDVNKYARTNAGGALWQATYQACRDEGRSQEQAEAFCNSKFFDHFYEFLIETLRKPMRKNLATLRRVYKKKKGQGFDEKYFLPEGGQGRFMAEEPFICPECRRASTKSKTSQVCVRCESEYQAGRNAPMRVPWPGDDGYYAETSTGEISSIGLKYPWVYAEPDVDGYLLGFECGDYWSTGTLFGGLTGNLSFINQTGQDHLSKCRTCARSAQKSAENTLRSPTPLSPIRPSEDWPKPTNRPRRPRRKPNPRPGPARRPF